MDHYDAPSQAQPRDSDLSVRLADVPDAIAAIAQGRMVIVVDAADRENEGDLVMRPTRSPPKRSTSWRHTDAG